MKFTIYEVKTGRVLFGGTTDNVQVLVQLGQAAIEGETYISGWVVDEVHHPLPPAPTKHHVFNYTTKQWEDPRTAATEWVVVRARRGSLLAGTDWVVTKAVEAGNPVPEAWTTYRQALRDVTKQADPFALVWPSPP